MAINLALTRLYIASEEDDYKLYPQILDSKFRLYSYYYVDKKGSMKFDKNIILDSGAYSFAYTHQGVRKGIGDLQAYVDGYIEYINTNDVPYFIEMDIDSLIGYDKVKEIRTYIEDKTRKKCIPSWHKERGFEDYIQTCKNYDWIAIGGIADSQKNSIPLEVINELTKIANKFGTKVHGLGFTPNLKKLKQSGFYSVDSTSWKGARFGNVSKFIPGVGIKTYRNDNSRIKDYKAANRHNLNEYLKYQNYLLSI